MPGERAQRIQAGHAMLLRIVAGLGMKLRPLAADLAHVAQHQQARRRQAREHVNRRAHRIGVGVVGVIDHNQLTCTIAHGERARAARDRAKLRQPLGDRCQRHARGHGAGGRRQRIAQVVLARDLQARVESALGRDDLHGPGIALPLGLRAMHVGALRRPALTPALSQWERGQSRVRIRSLAPLGRGLE